jgi:hypothetical protein
MPYTKTTWVDRVVSGGTVITVGTPLSASNLNKIENQLQTTTTLAEGALQTSTTGTTTITTSTKTQPALSLNKSGAGIGDGSQFLRLTTERSWSFFQRSTGATTSLSLQDNTGGKNFLIQGLDTGTSTPYTVATFSTGTTASNSFVTLAGALTVSSGGASITGNSTVTGTLTATSTLTAQNGLTVSAGTVSLPSGSITNSHLASNSVTQAKINSGSVGRGELITAVDSSYSGSLTASSTNGTLLGGTVNLNYTYTHAFFPSVFTSSAVAMTGNLQSGTDGKASFSLRNSASVSNSYTVHIRYVQA